MFAKLNAARLGSKVIAPDKKSRVDLIKNSIHEFEFLNKWLQEAKHLEGADSEKELVREMCSLLPVKLERELKA